MAGNIVGQIGGLINLDLDKSLRSKWHPNHCEPLQIEVACQSGACDTQLPVNYSLVLMDFWRVMWCGGAVWVVGFEPLSLRPGRLAAASGDGLEGARAREGSRKKTGGPWWGLRRGLGSATNGRVMDAIARFPMLANAAGPLSLTYLLGLLVVAVGVLLWLILRLKVQAFLALLISSLVVAVGSSAELTGGRGRLSLAEIGPMVESGMASSLGFIATIIGLGAIFGSLLEHSGGAQALARAMLRVFGEKRAPWAMLATGFVISIPVFLDVALVILAPIVYAIARRTGKSVLAYGLPLLAGMAVTHAFVPPTPGPVWVAYELGVGLGWVILFGCVVGIPTAVVAGIVAPSWMAGRIYIAPPEEEAGAVEEEGRLPSVGLIAGLIGLPVALIVAGTLARQHLAEGIGEGLAKADYEAALAVARDGAGLWLKALMFFGHPIMALLVATVGALVFLGYFRRVDRAVLMEVTTRALGPAGIIILITGAGGVFKKFLGESGVGDALKQVFEGMGIPVLLLAYAFAFLVRVAQGSATVAMVTAAGLIASLTEGLNQPQLALVVVAIAAGGTAVSHFNDSGFWMVSRYLRMTEKQTLQTWTVVSTLVSLVGYLVAQLVWVFVA
jgi:gluconate transporter